VCAPAKLQNIYVPPRSSYSRATHDSSPGIRQPERIQLITQSTSFRNRERVELYLHFPICLHGVHQDKCTAYNKHIYNYTIIDAHDNVLHSSALFFLLKTWTTLNFGNMLNVLNMLINTYMNTYLHLHTYIYRKHKYTHTHIIRTYIHTYTHTHTHTHTHTGTQKNASTNVRTHTKLVYYYTYGLQYRELMKKGLVCRHLGRFRNKWTTCTVSTQAFYTFVLMPIKRNVLIVKVRGSSNKSLLL